MLSNVGRMKRQSRLSVTHVLYRSLFDITGTLKDGVIVGAYAEVKHSFPQEVSHLTIRVCIFQSIWIARLSLAAHDHSAWCATTGSLAINLDRMAYPGSTSHSIEHSSQYRNLNMFLHKCTSQQSRSYFIILMFLLSHQPSLYFAWIAFDWLFWYCTVGCESLLRYLWRWQPPAPRPCQCLEKHVRWHDCARWDILFSSSLLHSCGVAVKTL